MVPDSLQLLLQAVITQGSHSGVKTSDQCSTSKDLTVQGYQPPSTGALYPGARFTFLMYFVVHAMDQSQISQHTGIKGQGTTKT